MFAASSQAVLRSYSWQIEHRQHRQAIPGPVRAPHQPTRRTELLHQPRRKVLAPPATRMPIPRKPPHVRRVHRVELPDALKPPSGLRTRRRRRLERLHIARLDPVISPHITDNSAVTAPQEVVRQMPTCTATIPPVQPERLRGNPDYPRIKIGRHHPIALKPGLEPDQRTRCRRPIPAWKVALALERRERTHRRDLLEPNLPALRQRVPHHPAVRRDVLHLEPGVIKDHGHHRPTETAHTPQAR